MKLILFDSNLEVLKKYTVFLEAEFDMEVQPESTIIPALRALKLTNGLIPSFFSLKSQDEEESFVDFFRNPENSTLSSNVIVVSDSKLDIPVKKHFSAKEYATESVAELLKSSDISFLKSNESDYKKVNIYSFSQFNNAPVDIFIRLSEKKYVKVVNCGDMYSSEVIEKYKKRSVKYLYVMKDDFECYLEDLSTNLFYLLEEDLVNQSTKFSLEKVSLDIIYKSLQSIGVTEKTIELTNKVMNSVISSVQSKSKLWSMLKKSILEVEHAAEHAVAISYLCTSMLEKLKWDSPGTLSKMTISAFFHDLSLNASLSFVRDLNGDLYNSLNDSEKKDFLSHPEKTILSLREIKRLPPNVEDIILEHHERPKGLGFPRKKTSFTIAPLTCVFILAEEFWYRINRVEMTREDAEQVIAEMVEDFHEGNFKKPLVALKEVVGERG